MFGMQRGAVLVLFTPSNTSLRSFGRQDPCVISVSHPPTLRLAPVAVRKNANCPRQCDSTLPGQPYINLIVIVLPSCINLCRYVHCARSIFARRYPLTKFFGGNCTCGDRHQIEIWWFDKNKAKNSVTDFGMQKNTGTVLLKAAALTSLTSEAGVLFGL